MYLRHSTTCLSSITLNYVFIWNWVCLEMLLGFYFNWFLFSLVFCFWKVAEFQVNASQSDTTTKLNRSSFLLLVKRINRLGFVHFPLSFFLSISLQSLISFISFCFPASRSLYFFFQSESSALVKWNEGPFPLP